MPIENNCSGLIILSLYLSVWVGFLGMRHCPVMHGYIILYIYMNDGYRLCVTR